MSPRRHLRALLAGATLAALVASSFAFDVNDLDAQFERAVAEHAATSGRTGIVRVRADAEQAQLLGEQFDLTEHGKDGWLDIVAYPGDLERLDQFGFTYEVVQEDLFALDLFQRLREDFLAKNLERSPADLQPCERLQGYRTLAEHNADLAALAEANPAFTRLHDLPNPTHEGRTVKMIQIAADPDNAFTDGRPTSVMVGLHHAREWPSAELTLMFACDIVEQYAAGNADIVDLLGRVNLLVVPIVNPDGFVRSRETVSDSVAPLPGAVLLAGSEFAYHRKNLRPSTNTAGLGGLLGVGVDPNRNYPYLWGGTGSSGSETGDTYRGPEPGSEPEVKNVMDLVTSNHVTTLITNHTFGELLLRPFGTTRRDAPDEDLLRDHADAMAGINGYTSQKGIDLYITDGTTDDWSYGLTGAPSFTFEIGPNHNESVPVGGSLQWLANTPTDCIGFHGTYQLCVGDFYADNRDAYLLNLRQAANTDWHGRLVGSATAGTVLTLVKQVEIPLADTLDGSRKLPQRLEATLVVGDTGTFRWHVNPSPLRRTLMDIEDGDATLADRETYTLSATFPDGTIRVVKDILVERGDVIEISFEG